MKSLKVDLHPHLAKRAEAAAKLVGTDPATLAQMGLNRACEEIEATGQIVSGARKGMRRTSIDMDETASATIELLAKTRGVKVEHLIRYFVEWSAYEAFTQGPGEIIECAIDAAEDYAMGQSFPWPAKAKEKLAECKGALDGAKEAV